MLETLGRLDFPTLVALVRLVEDGSSGGIALATLGLPDGYASSSPGPSGAPLGRRRPCTACGAAGTIPVSRRGVDGTVDCPTCAGRGYTFTDLSSEGGLRTDPTDPLRRKREHGYVDDSPTEAAVLGRMEDVCDACRGTKIGPAPAGDPDAIVPCGRCDGAGRRHADPVGTAVLGVFALLAGIAGRVDEGETRRVQALHVAERERGRENALPPDCRACGRAVAGTAKDPLRGGFCRACADSWYDWRRQPGNDAADYGGDVGTQRSAFITWRQTHRAEAR